METNYNNLKNGIQGGILSPEISVDRHQGAVSTVICNKTVTSDVGGDFTVPDHLPDIRKLIKVDVKPSPATKFISGGSVQLSGGVEYLAVYLGIDGGVYSASFPGEYSFSVPFDDSAARNEAVNLTAAAAVCPDSAVSRVSGARRMNIRCRLAAKATVLGMKSIDGGVSVSYDDHVQRLVKKSPYCIELRGSKDDIELIDEVDTSDEGIRYISSECRIFVEDAICGDGYADCRGTAVVKHLLCREDGETYTVTDKIPFSETVEIDKLTAGSPLCVSGMCSDIGMDVQGGDDTGEGKLRLALRVCLDVTAFKQSTLEYVKDVYSTCRDCISETETHRLPVLLACKNGNMTFGGSEELPKLGIGSDRINIVDVSGSAKSESLTCDGDKYTVNGKCRFGVVYFTEDQSDMMWAECELPFKYEFEGTGGDISRYECVVTAVEPRVRCDGEKMQFDCELAVSCFALGETEAEIISAVRIEGEANKARRGFTVCYPDKNDSLWSVAKRYCASVNATARENGLECSSDPDEIRLPDGIKYMIV